MCGSDPCLTHYYRYMKERKLSLRKRIGLRLFQFKKRQITTQHKLKYLMWECTVRCNLSCSFCGNGSCRKDTMLTDMPLYDFLKAFDEIAPQLDPQETRVVLTGGEPLLRTDLEECGRELSKRGFKWGIITNALILEKQRLTQLMRSGMSFITVNLDGVEEAHNKLRGNEHSFEHAVKAIELLAHEEDVKLKVSTCVSNQGYEDLCHLKDLLLKLGVKNWRLHSLFPRKEQKGPNQSGINNQEFKKLFSFMREMSELEEMNVSCGCDGFLGNYEFDIQNSFFFCRAGINMGTILVDGTISACPTLRTKYSQGNIYSDNFMDVWNNEYKMFRDDKWSHNACCKSCEFYQYCEGNGLYMRDENGKMYFCHVERKDQEESVSNLVNTLKH